MPAGEKRRRVGELREHGKSYAEIAAELQITKPTVAYHARRLGLPVDERAARRYDWDAVQEAYDGGLSVRDCARRFGFCHATWHAAVGRGAVEPRPVRMPLAQLLVAGRTQTARGHLKARLIEAGLKENCCEHCGLVEWRGKPINMQLHHTNGDGLDNRLENLELLCANCHSQTENWGGRNRRSRKLRLVQADQVGPEPTDVPGHVP